MVDHHVVDHLASALGCIHRPTLSPHHFDVDEFRL